VNLLVKVAGVWFDGFMQNARSESEANAGFLTRMKSAQPVTAKTSPRSGFGGFGFRGDIAR
jgi:hypothetical protein